MLAASAICAPNVSPAHAQAKVPTVAFVNVAVVPMDRERVLTRQTVVIRGNRITALGPVDQVRIPAGAKQIDGQNRFLLPGFGNMHAHLQVSYDVPIDTVPPEPIVERMLLLYLAQGVTTVRNMNGRPWHLQLRGQIARGDVLGPRIYTAGTIIDGDQAPTPAAAVREVKAQHDAGYDFIKIYDSVKRDVFDSLVATADRLGMPYAGHVPSFPGALERVLQTHFASDEHFYGYLESLSTAAGLQKTGIGYDSVTKLLLRSDLHESLAGVAAATQRAGLWNVPTLEILNTFGWVRSQAPLYNQLLEALHKAGAGLLVGTDGSAEDMTVAGELKTLVKAGNLTPYQALEMGTRNVAAFWGTLDSTGTVAVGKRADLVLLAGNPLVDIHRADEVIGVMVGGQWWERDALNARIDAAVTKACGPQTSPTWTSWCEQHRAGLP